MWYTSLPVDNTGIDRQRSTLRARRFNLPMRVRFPFTDRGNLNGRQCDLEAILEQSTALHSFSNPAPFVDYSLDFILEALESSAGSFFLWDERDKVLILKAARGPYRNRIQGVKIRLREGIAGHVARNGYPVLVKDVDTDQRFRSIKRNGRYRSLSFLSLPLIASNKLMGVINITEKKNRAPYDEVDLKRARVITSHISIAHENMRMRSRSIMESEQHLSQIDRLKAQLERNESLAVIGKVASHLSHELNNPLDAVRRYLNLAMNQVEEEAPVRDYLLKAKQGIRRSIRVIRELLAFTRENHKWRGKPKELHLILDDVLLNVRQYHPFDHIEVEKLYCGESIPVNEGGLHTVFQNLLKNACDAMNGEGKITIGTSRENGNAIVSLSDTGIGISKEMESQIFDPFFSTKDRGKGSGIGLTICREIIDRSGGRIDYRNGTKHGAHFIVTIPCHKEEAVVGE